ncbi:hypothetical protein HYFRA_00012377 [Hymenoscyphus fraxineus]|uniref:Uncharacterized protein n=1 Tax=Hymenoscyphus fraxineus TaxID=746836 RepID=A0A9N9L934_9HELO|nr:hypothetical protein HYFRA_00012377 [Hymenoscyphus fraxineus]
MHDACAMISAGNLRETLSNRLAQYRAKIMKYNETILDRELAKQQIDKESERKSNIASILEELWGGDRRVVLQKDIRKVSDLYQLIPDGTVPLRDPESQSKTFLRLEAELNQTIVESHRPISLPDEIKVFASLTGGLVGPGFAMLQETTVVTALLPSCFEVKSPDSLPNATGLLAKYGWEFLAGFQWGGSGHEGTSHVVYGICTNKDEHHFEKAETLGWLYVMTYSYDQVEVYKYLDEFVEDYTEAYAEMCEHWG